MSGRGLFNSGVVVRCLAGCFLLGLCFLSENLSSVLRGMEQRRQLRRRFPNSLLGRRFGNLVDRFKCGGLARRAFEDLKLGWR